MIPNRMAQRAPSTVTLTASNRMSNKRPKSVRNTVSKGPRGHRSLDATPHRCITNLVSSTSSARNSRVSDTQYRHGLRLVESIPWTTQDLTCAICLRSHETSKHDIEDDTMAGSRDPLYINWGGRCNLKNTKTGKSVCTFLNIQGFCEKRDIQGECKYEHTCSACGHHNHPATVCPRYRYQVVVNLHSALPKEAEPEEELDDWEDDQNEEEGATRVQRNASNEAYRPVQPQSNNRPVQPNPNNRPVQPQPDRLATEFRFTKFEIRQSELKYVNRNSN